MPGEGSAEKLAALLAYHQSLLADRRRNTALRRALAARVRPGDAVVDIGSGTGIWAVVAAGLGARRVVAIEREELLCRMIERLARENGVSDRVEVLCADAYQAGLTREFDVAIGEMVGTAGFEEGIVGHMAHAREHFVRPGGLLVPEMVGLQAAPVTTPGLAPADLRAGSFRMLAEHVPQWIGPGRLRTLTRSRRLLRVDLRKAEPTESLPQGWAEFALDDASQVSGLGVWVELGLAPGIRLSTRTRTHWGATLLPIERLPEGPGRIRFEVDWNPGRRRWRVDFEGSDGSRMTTEHGPGFALGALLLGSRGEGQRSSGPA